MATRSAWRSGPTCSGPACRCGLPCSSCGTQTSASRRRLCPLAARISAERREAGQPATASAGPVLFCSLPAAGIRARRPRSAAPRAVGFLRMALQPPATTGGWGPGVPGGPGKWAVPGGTRPDTARHEGKSPTAHRLPGRSGALPLGFARSWSLRRSAPNSAEQGNQHGARCRPVCRGRAGLHPWIGVAVGARRRDQAPRPSARPPGSAVPPWTDPPAPDARPWKKASRATAPRNPVSDTFSSLFSFRSQLPSVSCLPWLTSR
jgi:hypothetical protein